MDAVICTQHAEIPARWRCADCSYNYCSHCVPPDVLARVALCPCCDKPLDELSAANAIPPFWNVLPRLFRMALAPEALAVIAGLALLWGVAAASGLFGLVLLLVATGTFSWYSTRTMHRIAYGYLDPPPHPLQDQPGFANVRKQFVAFFLLFLAAGLAGGVLHSPVVTLILLVLGILLMPAVYMTVVVTDSLGNALNPGFLMRVAFGVGWPYLLLWVLLLLIAGGSGQLQHFVAHAAASKPLGFAVAGFFSMYFGLVMTSLMGYVAYQHHELFGHSVRDPVLEGADGKAQRRLDPPDRADLLLGLGKIEQAQADLEQRLRREPGNMVVNERYHRLLIARRDAPRAKDHADFFIGKLVQARRYDQAWRVYQEHVAQFGPLEIKDGDDALQLAKQARAQRQGKQALPLLDRFAQRFPNHPSIPAAWLLTAQILAEDLHDDAKGLMVISALLKRYPDHAIRQEAERYAATLQRLAEARKRAPAPGRSPA